MSYIGKSNEIAKSGQQVIMTELGKMGKTKVKLSIRSDAYQFQSWARVYVWSEVELKWNVAWAIEPANMATREGLAYGPVAATRKDFEKDRQVLLTQLAFILE